MYDLVVPLLGLDESNNEWTFSPLNWLDPAPRALYCKDHTFSSTGGIIIGKLGTLPKFSDMLTLSQPEGADYAHPLVLLA